MQWNEFDSIMGIYDMTDQLHKKFKLSGDFIASLTKISNEYYERIMEEEDVNAG